MSRILARWSRSRLAPNPHATMACAMRQHAQTLARTIDTLDVLTPSQREALRGTAIQISRWADHLHPVYDHEQAFALPAVRSRFGRLVIARRVG